MGVLSDVGHYLWAMLYRQVPENSIRKNDAILIGPDLEPRLIFQPGDKPAE